MSEIRGLFVYFMHVAFHLSLLVILNLKKKNTFSMYYISFLVHEIMGCMTNILLKTMK